MRNRIIQISVLVFVIFLNACKTDKANTKDDDFSTKESFYFEQKPPGLIPEIFAQGIISIDGRYEHGISFSPDLSEIYFSANKKDEEASIYFSKLEEKKWTPIKKANFTKGDKDSEMHPFVSPDDKRIYFVSNDSEFPPKL